jgi:hypothetical protein
MTDLAIALPCPRPERFSLARGIGRNDVVLAAWTHSFAPGGEAESPDSIGVPTQPAIRGRAEYSWS